MSRERKTLTICRAMELSNVSVNHKWWVCPIESHTSHIDEPTSTEPHTGNCVLHIRPEEHFRWVKGPFETSCHFYPIVFDPKS